MKSIDEDKSPFLFGKTVADNSFINRTKDIEHLWLNMKNGINTVLISPRRWGKSSLVEHTARLKQNSKNIKIIEKNDFIEKFGKKIYFLDPAFELWFKKIYMEKNINDIFKLWKN